MSSHNSVAQEEHVRKIFKKVGNERSGTRLESESRSYRWSFCKVGEDMGRSQSLQYKIKKTMSKGICRRFDDLESPQHPRSPHWGPKYVA